MKKLIVLPGNSPHNRQWGEECAEYFRSWFDEAYVQSYDHWDNGESHINFEREMDNLGKEVSETPASTEWVVFAKSVGSILAFLSIDRGIVSPAHCVFFGMPFDLASQNIFKDDWSPVDNFAVPSVAFHNLDDPTAGHDFTKDMIATHNPNHITLITTKGSNHDYLNFSEYESDIKKLLEI